MYRVQDQAIGNHDVVVLASGEAGFIATIAPGFGGACVSLRHGGDELLHGAKVFDQGAMKGRIPVLFPVVGRSFEKGELGIYRHRGRTYPMDIHGFVKDMPWLETNRSCSAGRASLTCEVTSTDETRRSYPYEFSLSIEYVVEDAALCIIATIRNLGDELMPFCFGYHPYFRAPIGAGGTASGRREDCIIRIPGKKVWEMSEGQPTGRRLDAPPEFAAGLPLPPDHLEKIMTDIQRQEAALPQGAGASWCELECPEAGKIIRVEFDEQALETVTVFSPPDSGFVCLEPRCGLPNALSDSAPVRDGLKELGKGGAFQTTVCVRVITTRRR